MILAPITRGLTLDENLNWITINVAQIFCQLRSLLPSWMYTRICCQTKVSQARQRLLIFQFHFLLCGVETMVVDPKNCPHPSKHAYSFKHQPAPAIHIARGYATPSSVSALSAASCSACFLLRPMPVAMISSSSSTLAVNSIMPPGRASPVMS